MMLRGVVLASVMLLPCAMAQAQSEAPPLPAQPKLQLHGWALSKAGDRRIDFIRACTAHMSGRWAHPQQVCGCLHDHAVAVVEDADLREALLRGIGETGVPRIEVDWVPPSKQSRIAATFTQIARPTMQCMFDPLT
jgi:hypothetical protein